MGGGGSNVLAIYVTFHLYLHLYLHTMMNAVSSVADYLLIFTMFCEGRYYLLPMFFGARTFYVLSYSVHVFIQTMMYAGASIADSLCHINHWGRCSVPINTLDIGLKHRQLDTVSFFLKSKENSKEGFTNTYTYK